MPNANDLTTVADLGTFITPALTGTALATASPNLQRIITAVSDGINRACSRTFAVAQLSEVRNGNGRESMRTLRYPILSVQSVVISPIAGAPGQTLTPASSGGQSPSVIFDDWFIYLTGGYFGSLFRDGRQNVTLNYTAGFITPGQLQLQLLPAWAAGSATLQNAQIQVNGYYYQAINAGTTGGSAPATWLTVTNSITMDNGIGWLCLGPVPSLPAGASLIPDDLTQACLQQSALLYKNRTRVGDTGSGVGPDKINYFLKDAHPSTVELIKRHREVFPIDGMGVQ